MASRMKWGSPGLLVVVLMLPSLVPAAILNWNRRVEAVDNALRANRRETDEVAAPAFCHGLDCPEFKVIKDEPTYQLREYVATQWVSTTSVNIDFDDASDQNFGRLFEYISGENVKNETIKMTAPVLTRIIPGPGPACKNNFTMSFFVSPKEGDPPKPTDPSVSFTKLDKMRVYVRSFGGRPNKDDWLKEAEKLGKDLDREGEHYRTDYYYIAGYDSPFRLFNRHNEIWFIAA